MWNTHPGSKGISGLIAKTSQGTLVAGFAAVVAALLLGLFGCIRTHHTIEAHVTLDIRYVEQQADEILDYVQGESETLTVVEPKESSQATPLLQQIFGMQVAHAQEDYTKIIADLATKMKNRQPQIAALKREGCAGEDNRGYVRLRPCEKLDAADAKDAKNEAQKLIAAENQDRKDMYKAIAEKDKSKGVTIDAVEQVFAKGYRSRAKTGDIVQLPPAGKDFDEFKASAAGKKLGDEAKPDAWVTIK